MFKLLSRPALSERQRLLQATPLFDGLSPRELGVLDALLHERRYQAEEVVFDEGEQGEALYLVLQGRVQVRRQAHGPAPGTADAAGMSPPIAELGPGSFFGDLALLDDTPRMAQARAIEDTRLAAFFRSDFLGLLETHGALASRISLALARHLGQRLRLAVQAQPGDRILL